MGYEIVTQSGGTNRSLTYDYNGSLVGDGSTRTFEWDAANRLVAINYTGTTNRSEFTYDGLNRCAKIVEKTNGSVTSTRKFVWCGNDKCEFRDANDAVTLFLYPQGQYSGTKYFYTRDQLGSIREMFKTNDVVVGRYDYDPWGRSTTKVSTLLPDFNYTGLYRHGPSNLDMAVYRFYDPELGRWLSRDPLENAEQIQGLNLYTYVSNDPTRRIDPLGLFGWKDIVQSLGKTLAKGAVLKGIGYGTFLNPTEIGGPVQPPGPWNFVGETPPQKEGQCCTKVCYYIRRASSRSPDYFEETRSITIDCDQSCPPSLC